MAPLADARGHQLGQRWPAELGAPHVMKFPSWTRGDGDEDTDYTHNRQTASRGDGTNRGTRTRVLSTGKHNRDALTPTPVKRGLLKLFEDAAAPVVSAVFKPFIDKHPFIPKIVRDESSGDDDTADGEESGDSDDDTTAVPKPTPKPAEPSSVEGPPVVEVPAKPSKPASVRPPSATASPSSKDNAEPSIAPPTTAPSSPAPTTKDDPSRSQPTPGTGSSAPVTLSAVVPGRQSSATITEPGPAETSKTGLVVSPTPIVTGVPALSSGDRKGVGSAAPDPLSSEKSSYYSETSTTATSYEPYETVDAAKSTDNGQRSGMSEGGEKAVIAAGAVGGILVIGLISWLLRRYMKRSHPGKYNDWKRRLPSSAALDKPKRRVASALSRVPFVKTGATNSGWENLDDPVGDRFLEKGPLSSHPAAQTKSAGIRVQTEFSRKSEHGHGVDLPMNAHSREPNPVVSSLQVPFNRPSGSNAQYVNIRASDISSLSSGFGDGDIIMPPAAARTTAANAVTSEIAAALSTPISTSAPHQQQQQLSSRRNSDMDASRSKRDTMSTQASEDSPPRFRTVNSWVRQQSGRVKRARLRDNDAPPVPDLPPEQDFALMMPDGQVPRRVEEGRGVAK